LRSDIPKASLKACRKTAQKYEEITGEGLPCGDKDGDGVPDKEDNCPTQYNPDQRDSDTNGLGDECECPYFSYGSVYTTAVMLRDSADWEHDGDMCFHGNIYFTNTQTGATHYVYVHVESKWGRCLTQSSWGGEELTIDIEPTNAAQARACATALYNACIDLGF
jgi:hypothetical protein